MTKPSTCTLVLLLVSALSAARVFAAEEPAPAAAKPKLGDTFSFKSDDGAFALQLTGRVQPAVEIEQGLSQGGEPGAAFFVRRARLGAAGHLFTKDARFKVEAAFDRGFARLNDGYVEYAFVPDWVVVRGGQFKRPFAREFITSSGKLETLEESLATKESFADRDLGVMLHNDYTKSPAVEYAVGFFNGQGATPRFDGARFTHVPDLFHPALVARIGMNMGELAGYSEADLEGGPLRFGVAGSLALDLPGADATGSISSELDFVLKAHGAFATGALHLASPPLDGSVGNPLLGVHLEGSYLFADAIAPVVGYGLLAPIGSDELTHEITGGVAVFFFGHNLKLLSDATLGIEQDGPLVANDVTVRFAGSLSF